MNIVDKAMLIAMEAHHGIENKHSGEPYILHPYRVYTKVRDAGLSEEFQAVALLHDVVEDTDVTLKDLSDAGFSDDIVNGVDGMTKRPGETLEEYYYRCRRDRLSRVVKPFDIDENFGRNHMIEDDATRLRMAKKYSLGTDILKRT